MIYFVAMKLVESILFEEQIYQPQKWKPYSQVVCQKNSLNALEVFYIQIQIHTAMRQDPRMNSYRFFHSRSLIIRIYDIGSQMVVQVGE